MSSSKLLDMADCRATEFHAIYAEMEEIIWGMQSGLGRLLIKALRRERLILPMWSRRWEYPWAVLSADLRPGLSALDAGCGGSPLLTYLARRGLRCFGVDCGRDPKSLHWKDKLLLGIGVRYQGAFFDNFSTNNGSITLKREPIESLSFHDDSFDRVFCISVLEHIRPAARRDQAMREMARVVKPGGLLILTMDLPRDDPYAHESVVQASGLHLVGRPDYSIERGARHGYNYEIAGLVLEK